MMSNVVSMLSWRLSEVRDEICEAINVSVLPDPGSPEANADYYAKCEEVLAAFTRGDLGAGAALSELHSPSLAWIEGGCTMRQLVANEICRAVDIEPEEVTKWKL